MSVHLKLRCAGCGAKAEVRVPYESSGRISTLAPPGWVMFDPYTRVTYCGPCWQSILEPEEAESVA